MVLPVPATPITTTTWGVRMYCLAVFLDIRRHGGVATLKPIRYDEFKSL
ncbi:hypothetical protein GPN2_12586 [Streptomyces murinus]